MSRPDLSELMKDIDKRSENMGERSRSLLKTHPMLTIGLAGASLILLNQIRNFKNRGNMRISDYIIHTRVYVQGFFSLAITFGLGYEVYKFYSKKWYTPQQESTKAISEDSSK